MQIDINILIILVLLVTLFGTLFLLIKEKAFSKNETELKNSIEKEYIALKSRYEAEIKASNEKLKLLQDAKDELSLEFKNLANQIFEDKSKQFSSSNKEQLELLLKPFREQVANFSKQTQERFEVELKDRHLLKDELYRLKEMNAQLASEAINLTKALKGENKTQGNWGEIVLEKILEQSGLRKGVEYELQATLKNEENKTYRPDVVVHMPGERDIVIDSKVSLTAYERFMNSEDELDRKQALKEHIGSISNHVKELSAKSYENLENINSLDFVLLFMPIEGAFLLALESDGEFFKRAYDQNILVVSPSTLLVTLRTIEHIWRTQRQEEHAQKIAKEAEAMYDKLVLFLEEMNNIGNQIQKTHDSYEKAMNRLSSGRGNVIKRAQNIVKLGIKTKKELPVKTNEDE
ncbi:DNA recombination protein RmuC [Sulfurimonas marina]|uniref:DNA recombination protein RmuC n=1 Tax=Sulfurimonas marina TaxID=2590551 RepID=A0A7M1AT31_9BACT|nr:DNA recombination protein RmuC [Sulfurimonas marina]QOP40575.1 DNA recombination protein RmuC [Sulfurimonas marina]